MLTETKEKLIDNMTDNLPVLRKKLKMSQEALAEVIGNSRYTVMLIEAKKRRMMWSTFMSLILLFDKNSDTSSLLRALEIYTDELDEYLKNHTSESDFLNNTETVKDIKTEVILNNEN